jgi:hypothetical protein
MEIMSTHSNKLETIPMFPIGGIEDENIRDYSNELFFIKKDEQAQKTLDSLIWPKELLDKIKKPSAE